MLFLPRLSSGDMISKLQNYASSLSVMRDEDVQDSFILAVILVISAMTFGLSCYIALEALYAVTSFALNVPLCLFKFIFFREKPRLRRSVDRTSSRPQQDLNLTYERNPTENEESPEQFANFSSACEDVLRFEADTPGGIIRKTLTVPSADLVMGGQAIGISTKMSASEDYAQHGQHKRKRDCESAMRELGSASVVGGAEADGESQSGQSVKRGSREQDRSGHKRQRPEPAEAGRASRDLMSPISYLPHAAADSADKDTSAASDMEVEPDGCRDGYDPCVGGADDGRRAAAPQEAPSAADGIPCQVDAGARGAGIAGDEPRLAEPAEVTDVFVVDTVRSAEPIHLQRGDTDLFSVLDAASSTNHQAEVEDLVSTGMDGVRPTGEMALQAPVPPLHAAVLHGGVDEVRDMAVQGADMNAEWRGWTPLALAICYSSSEVAIALVEHGARTTSASSPAGPQRFTNSGLAMAVGDLGMSTSRAPLHAL